MDTAQAIELTRILLGWVPVGVDCEGHAVAAMDNRPLRQAMELLAPRLPTLYDMGLVTNRPGTSITCREARAKLATLLEQWATGLREAGRTD